MRTLYRTEVDGCIGYESTTGDVIVVSEKDEEKNIPCTTGEFFKNMPYKSMREVMKEILKI